MKLIKYKIYQGTQYKASLFGKHIFSAEYGILWGWFRILGKGLNWKHKSLGLTFSQRNRHSKYFIIGNWIFRILK